MRRLSLRPLIALALSACGTTGPTRAALVDGAGSSVEQPTTRASAAVAVIEGGNGGERRRLGGPTRPVGTLTPIDFASIPLTSQGSAARSDDTSIATNWQQAIFAGHGYRATGEWTLLDESHRTVDAAPVAWFDGPRDGAKTLSSKTAETAPAVALVPGLLYAFRRCQAGCALGDAKSARREMIILIGPRAIWTGSSTTGGSSSCGQFGEVDAELAPQGSATLVLVLSAESIAAFQRGPDAVSPSEARSFSLEIVWPKGSDPLAMLYSGTIDPPYRLGAPNYPCE